MTFFKYVHDHYLAGLFFIFCVALTNLILWLQPQQTIAVSDLLYLDVLLGLFFCLYFSASYWQQRRWYREIKLRRAAGADSLTWRLEPSNRFAECETAAYVNQLLDYHQQSLEQLRQAQQDQKEFIASWVHDIKVPLAALQMLNETYQAQLPEKANYQLTDELTRIDHYVEQVLYYSRLDAFSKDYLIQEYALAPIINQVVSENATYFLHKQIHFQLVGAATVLTDEKWLHFILTQIISNSLKYTATSGQITVSLQQNQQGVQLQISDTGIGIPEQDLSRIFTKGFTGSNGRQVVNNATGLGLYLAQQMCIKLGHQLSVTSTVGVGTTMTLLFPFLSYYDNEFSPTTH
ncbi:sensor histidine kinase [Loigolactobacillus jiayinensis]|uniref:histidine kinase n=1 Tax=Loigolactobacillus jiayinensis TaxID=2486016 RepID=A0ABW1RGE3_9LACO|nr:sensor histidine kinase [Loigolactobacillus jiayinensis]